MAAARRGGAPAGPALAWTLLSAAAGCGAGAPPAVTRMMPAVAYTDSAVATAIYGDSFRPTYHIDARSGAASVDPGGFSATLSSNGVAYGYGTAIDLDGIVWQSAGLLAAEIPAATPAGWYDLTVRDPRGGTSTLIRAFESLGIDTQPPIVRITSPAAMTQFSAGAQVPVVIVVDDVYGAVSTLDVVMSSGSGAEQTYSCTVTGQSVVTCPFTFPAPAPATLPDVLTITATATGSGGLVGQARSSYPLSLGPDVNALDPNSGSTLGGTEVRIVGAGFVPDQTVVEFDGQMATIEDLTPTAITVLTPQHTLPGIVHVTLLLPGLTLQVKSLFTYLAPPLVRQIQPLSGPAQGGFPVTIVGDNFSSATTQIYFGTTTPLRCPTFVSSSRIDGLAPPGFGTEAVTAVDSKAGSIPNATVPFQYTQDGGVLGPIDTAGLTGDADLPDAGALDAGCPAGGT